MVAPSLIRIKAGDRIKPTGAQARGTTIPLWVTTAARRSAASRQIWSIYLPHRREFCSVTRGLRLSADVLQVAADHELEAAPIASTGVSESRGSSIVCALCSPLVTTRRSFSGARK